MKKYYIDNFNIDNISNIEYNINNEKIILTPEGVIKIIKNDYVLFKFIDKPYKIIENFIDNNSLYIDNSFYKKDKTVYNIPLDHTFVDITYKKHKLNNNIYFVKEILNKNVIDYYFLADCNIDILQNTIFTFLHQLN